MRIIGGRDYYDGAGYGVDSSITFVRSSLLLPSKNTPLQYLHRNSFHVFDVVLAGSVYTGLCVNDNKFIYDQEEASIFAETLPRYEREYCDLSNSNARKERVKQGALENKVTTAISGIPMRSYGNIFNSLETNRYVLADSDKLRAVEFYRAVPPTEAHRAISSWVGGVLPFNAPIVQLSDKSKIQKAGFDLRTSFRKMKA